MKIRSSLLVACIVVVPLIAMFSHRMPPAARAAVSRWLRDVAAGSHSAGPPVHASRPGVHAVAEPTVSPAIATAPVAEGPRVVPVAAVVPAVEREAGASGRLEQLRALGATAIDCRPLPGAGGHVASCRVPVDGAGQLERVFQATGADPGAAADKLFGVVNAWQRGATAEPGRTMRF